MRSLRAAADCHWLGRSSASLRWQAVACAAGLGRSRAGIEAVLAGIDFEHGIEDENVDVAEKAKAAHFATGADDAGVNDADFVASVVFAESTGDQSCGRYFDVYFAFAEHRFWRPSGFAVLPFYFCDPSVCVQQCQTKEWSAY